MIFRKRIFIGEADDRAVYFDTKTKEPLIADKSVLLDTERAGRTNRYIPHLIIGGTLLVTGSFLGFTDALKGKFSPNMTPFFILGVLLVGVGVIVLMELALYPHVNQTVPASQEEFHEAIYTNLFWRNFNTPKVTILKYIFFLFLIGIMIPTTVITIVAGIPGIIQRFDAQEPFTPQVFIAILSGAIPAILYLLLFQNNPIRWLNVVRKYQKGEIVFQKVNGEKVEGEKVDDK